MSQELDDTTYNAIVSHCEEGNNCCDQEDYENAIIAFKKALDLIPPPLEIWETTTWVVSSLGDCHFQLCQYEQAHHYLTFAMHCPDGLGNPFIHLRLGQTQFELHNLDRAADELTRAYMGDGESIFEDEDSKYFRFLQSRISL